MATYNGFRLYVGPHIQEKGDGGILTIASSPMEGGISILKYGQTQIDIRTDSETHIWNTGIDLPCLWIVYGLLGPREQPVHSHSIFHPLPLPIASFPVEQAQV